MCHRFRTLCQYVPKRRIVNFRCRGHTGKRGYRTNIATNDYLLVPIILQSNTILMSYILFEEGEGEEVGKEEEEEKKEEEKNK